MDKIKIKGGRQLNGEIFISGAKNAALPLICASLLTEETVTLTNMPILSDIKSMNLLLSSSARKLIPLTTLSTDIRPRLIPTVRRS